MLKLLLYQQRGVNLDGSDFAGQNLKGVAFQQSIVRDSNFKGCNLVGSSFFDATVDGSDFSDAGRFWETTASSNWKVLPLAVDPRFRCFYSHHPSVCGGGPSFVTFVTLMCNRFIV